MKKILTLIIIVFCAATLFAQAPEKFSYQAVVRNASNALVTNAQVGVRVSILQGSANGEVLYVETHSAVTNANALMTLEIGGGETEQGAFDRIDWANGPFFLKTETDPNGGSSYSITSVQQLLSVPYALYAKDAGNGFSGDYNDLTNKPDLFSGDYNDLVNQPTIPTVPTDVSVFNNDAGYITMDSVPAIPTNVSAFTNDVGYLTGYTETDPQFSAWDKDYNDLINTPAIPTVPTDISVFNNDAGYITMDSVPTIPTNVSAFTNDVGYLTDYTETDPEFNAWDKDYNDLINLPQIPQVPENVSAFNNDVPYLTEAEYQQDMNTLNNTLDNMENTIDSLRNRIDELEGHHTPPTVMTTGVADVAYTTATLNGSVVYIGGAPVAARGFCYDTVMHPTVESSTVSCGSGSGSFSTNLLNLRSSTTYYVRAFATNIWGTNYGEEKTFTTLVEHTPSVEILPASDISYTSFVCSGDVTDSGTYTVTARGFCWSTEPDPVMSGDHLHVGNGAGAFSATLTDMQPETTFYVCSYAVNAVGVTYSTPITVTTLTPTIPTVSTDTVNGYNECTGTVLADGNAPVTQRGFCYDTLPNPTLENGVVLAGDGMGEFTATISGLPIGKMYFVRAFATNAKGTVYGNQIHFLAGCDTKTLTDYDGNVYNTVTIGTQCWMKENLKTTHYSDGWPIEHANVGIFSYETAYYYYPSGNNSTSYVETYGLLYNWAAIMHGESSSNAVPSGVQGICPNGWHVPSNAEWSKLMDFVSGSERNYFCSNNTNNIAKALAATSGWNTSSHTCAVGNEQISNNATNFSALPAGSYTNYGGFSIGNGACFWSATESYNSGEAWFRYLSSSSATVTNTDDGKSQGYSVRCLRD